MELQNYQQKLAGLIQGSYTISRNDSSHLRSIADSVNLQVTQEVIVEWRELSIEHYCHLTSSALKQFGLFHKEIQSYISIHGFSPYVEELGNHFLTVLEAHDLELIACIAGFERALINTQHGMCDQVTLKWRHNPYAVLTAIMKGTDLKALQPTGAYQIHVAKDLPGLFRVVELRDKRSEMTLVR